MMKRLTGAACATVLLLVVGAATPGWGQIEEERVASSKQERSTFKAMWLSIAHPGLGEWYLKGWGRFEECPQKKFWLGFIPLYGWPGFLQVKSAVDAVSGDTNDDVVVYREYE